jgi:hypothetical protein
MALLGFAALATTTSIALAATAGDRSARISAPATAVGFGERFALDGSVPLQGESAVRIQFRRAGTEAWRVAREARTDRTGAYRVRLRAKVSGAYRAVPRAGSPSAPVRVAVRAHTAFHVGRHHTRAGRRVRVTGRVRPGGRRAVKVVVRGPGGSLLRHRTSRSGRFALGFEARKPGVYRLRAHAAANRKARSGASRVRRITVYRPAQASWYGPGFYGNRTACGQVLTPGTLGVAHKTMPCGTKLTLRHGRRVARVRVIDRGPFAGHREFDLTSATKRRLGFPDLGVVWVSR